MNDKTLEFHFDFGSPTTYLAYTQGPRIAQETAAFTDLVGDAAVKADLMARTEASEAGGAFGAPTFFVGEQMFFGQDRLDFVREALIS